MTSALATMSPRDPETAVKLLQEELEATNREVMLLTLELEQRVADRTAQLLQANQELHKEIAERLRAEQEIKQLNLDLARRAELLVAANDELEAFSSSVSHDLRNPLARILGFASLLRDDAAAILNEKNRQYLEKICFAATQMVALIDDLLRLAHSSKVELAWTKVDLNEMMDAVLAELEQETRGATSCGRAPLSRLSPPMPRCSSRCSSTSFPTP